MLNIFLLAATLTATTACALTSAQSDLPTEFEGTIHNSFEEGRATLKVGLERYALDFQGFDLYGVAEHHDREHVIVSGWLDRYAPVIRVESITFRPYGRSVTYDLSSPPVL